MKRFNVWIAAVALVFLPASGCDWFDDPSPETALVMLEGAAGEQVEILLSKQFITGIDSEQTTQVELFQADTLIRTLPFDTLVNIRTEQRFLVRTVDADTVPSQVRMQVEIDGTTRYDIQASVDVEQLLFLFAFNQPITSFVELL